MRRKRIWELGFGIWGSGSLLRILLCVAGALTLGAVIIDRVAVTVGDTAITASQVDVALRITAFLNEQKPVITPQAKRQAADRLVEQMLVKNELVLSHYPLPPASEAARMAAELVQNRFRGERARFGRALEQYGITEADLQEYFLWQLTFLRFIDVRFRPGVEVTDQDVRDYFEKVVKPLAEKTQPGRLVRLDQYRASIERTLVAQRVDQELNRWLQGARRRTNIQYHEDAFR